LLKAGPNKENIASDQNDSSVLIVSALNSCGPWWRGCHAQEKSACAGKSARWERAARPRAPEKKGFVQLKLTLVYFRVISERRNSSSVPYMEPVAATDIPYEKHSPGNERIPVGQH
jgi:hypothetical protein